MRRAPSLNSSRGKLTTEAQEDDNDTILGADHELRPQLTSSRQAKSEMQKSAFTVFGLQPSPELLSISMGKRQHAGNL